MAIQWHSNAVVKAPRTGYETIYKKRLMGLLRNGTLRKRLRKVPMTEYEKMLKAHPIIMRWESFKLSVGCFFWRFHPRRNRWCSKCGQYSGCSYAAEKQHRC